MKTIIRLLSRSLRGPEFYFNLARDRTRRLRHKWLDLREASGSRLLASLFVSRFVLQRFGYFVRHARARFEIPRIRRSLSTEMEREQPTVAIKITGGIGDYIIAARFLRDMLLSTEQFEFDLYCNRPEVANWVFASNLNYRKSYSEFLFDDLRPEYDLALWVSHFVVSYTENARWLKLRACPRLCTALQNGIRFRPKIEKFILSHPQMDNFLARRMVMMNVDRMNLPHGMFKISKGDDILDLAVDEGIVTTLGLSGRPYITIHNGFDPEMVVRHGTSTKCYPHFPEVVRQIKRALPDLPIVQLGSSTSAPIEGIDYNLIEKTSLREAAGLIKNAVWHLDIESGLVHMARCFGIQSTVIFGPTPEAYFGYKENRNIPPSACGDCWWITETWMAHCPRGFPAPICTNQDPSLVAHQVIECLRVRLARNICGVDTDVGPISESSRRAALLSA